MLIIPTFTDKSADDEFIYVSNFNAMAQTAQLHFRKKFKGDQLEYRTADLESVGMPK
jgi:hypothetical protein